MVEYRNPYVYFLNVFFMGLLNRTPAISEDFMDIKISVYVRVNTVRICQWCLIK